MTKKALVFGASMAGLLAARALTESHDEVLVVDRDDLPTDAQPRKATPQAKHNHLLLAHGGQIAEKLFPGLTEELIEAGVPLSQMSRHTHFIFSGESLARGDCQAALLQASRSMLEHTLRKRVAALPNVSIMGGHEAAGPIIENGRIVGGTIVQVADGTTQTIDADLVVDATGRSGRMQTWLKEQGYQAAQEERIECDVTYVSRFVRMPTDALDGDLMLLVGAKPELPHLLGVTRLEGDRWSVTIAAMAGIRPPTDEQGFLDFLDTMPVSAAAKPIREAEPLSDIVVHRFPYSLRRRYERLRQAPEGLIALGDAMCSFNPIYGQGMTVAAMEALALRDCLATSDTDVSRRYFKAASRLIDTPWQLAAGGDLGIPAVKGRRTPMVRAMNAYIARLHKAAATDPEVTVAFLRVIGFLEQPSALFAPRILSRAVFPKTAT